MTAPVVFTVRGHPKASPRPRARSIQTKAGNHIASVYAGKTDKNWKQLVAAAARDAWGNRPVYQGPVEMSLMFYFIRPKSVSAAKRPQHTIRPDLDNLWKSVKDSLTGLVWKDDSQVIRGMVRKDYWNGSPDEAWTGAIVEVSFPC